MSSAPALSAADRAWLREWDRRFGEIEKVDLGQRGTRKDALEVVRAEFRKTPQYAALPKLAMDLMAFHRDRLMGTPAYKDPELAKVMKEAADLRAQSLDHAMQEQYDILTDKVEGERR